MKNTQAKKSGWSNLPKWGRIAILVGIGLLVAGLIFGLVWTNLDHSFRYDKEDLTPYLSQVKAEDCFLPIDLNYTNVSGSVIAEAIANNIGSLKAEDYPGLKKTDLPMLADDYAYLYYQVYKLSAKNGESEPSKELLFENADFHKAENAEVVQLGKGDFCKLLEDWLVTNGVKPSDTPIVRREKEKIPEATDTIVLTLKGTYGDKKSEYKDLTYNSAYIKSDELIGKTAELNTKVREKLAGKKIGESLSFTLNLSVGTVTFTGKIEAAFSASEKEADIKLTEDLKYENEAGQEVIVDKDTTIRFVYLTEYFYRLDADTVKALYKDKNDVKGFVEAEFESSKEEFPSLDDNQRYARAYQVYMRDKLEGDDIAAQKKENDTYASDIKAALWEQICKQYATESYIKEYPAGVVESYYKTAMENYRYQYNSGSVSKTTYPTIEKYILHELEADSEYSDKKTTAELNAIIKAKLEANGREQTARKLVLFSLLNDLGHEITKAELQEKEDEIYESYVDYYTNLYTMYSSAGITEMTKEQVTATAKSYAQSSVDSLSASYLRESVAMDVVLEHFLTGEEGSFDYTLITWNDTGK